MSRRRSAPPSSGTAPRIYAKVTCLCGRIVGCNVLRQHRAHCRAQLQIGERAEDETKLLEKSRARGRR